MSFFFAVVFKTITNTKQPCLFTTHHQQKKIEVTSVVNELLVLTVTMK